MDGMHIGWNNLTNSKLECINEMNLINFTTIQLDSRKILFLGIQFDMISFAADYVARDGF